MDPIGWPFWVVFGSFASVLVVAAACFLIWLRLDRRHYARYPASPKAAIRRRHRGNTAVATAAANTTSAIL